MMKTLCCTVLAALALAPAPASAQTTPVGIVSDPCVGIPPLPEAAKAYFRAMLDPATAKPLPPPSPELIQYKVALDKAKAGDWADLCHYRADNMRLAALPASARRIVYMGDSITELWGIADPDLFSNGRINRGISGQTTAQMLLRFQPDVIALHPQVVHIMAGTNDLAGNTGPTTIDDIRNNIVAMVTLARANGIRVVLASVPPTTKFSWRPALAPGPQVIALNAWLKEYAQRVGATYVDYYSLLATPGGAMQPDLTVDGVHANSTGYRRIAALSRAATEPTPSVPARRSRRRQ